jgi:EAL domain-containing protein (putative c-di-GMP-specific phosphodiesterase class I)
MRENPVKKPAIGGTGGTIHHLFPKPRQSDCLELRLTLRCMNYQQVEAAYGEEAYRKGLKHVARIIEELFGQGGFVDIASADRLEAVLWDRGLLSEGPLDSACDQFVRWLCMAIAALPFEHEGRRIHLSFGGSWSIKAMDAAYNGDGVDGPDIGHRHRGAFPIDSAADVDAWTHRYRADMGQAGELLNLMANDRLTLVWQRITRSPGYDEILYHEALLRTIVDDGMEAVPDGVLGSMERLGLVQLVDQLVVAKVVDELEAYPTAVLGANISARSAAQRLVIEITATAALRSISETVSFVDRMRALGCRIALDHFGVGHGSIRQLIALKPDIVKIDGFFLRRAMSAKCERATLRHLIGLAGSMAPTVVVDGVEDVAGSEFAAEAGAAWQQGRFCDHPAIIRPQAGNDTQRAALVRLGEQGGNILTEALKL